MGIKVSTDHQFYIFALVTERIERNIRLYAFDDNIKAEIKEFKKTNPNLHECVVYAAKSYYKLVHEKGLSDSLLEQACADFEDPDLLIHPISGSKDITDAFIRENILAEFSAFMETLEGLGERTRNKRINEFLASFKKGFVKRCNLKGMKVELNEKKNTFSVTISLSRSTKGQNEKHYSVEIACNEFNNKLENILDSFVVWFRKRGKDKLWQHKVVAFSPLAFFVKNFNDFKQHEKKKKGEKQKQYKYNNHTKFTNLTINTGASYQFNCLCSDLESFIKESGAEVLYDSWEE